MVVSHYQSPIGWLELHATDKGLTQIHLNSSSDVESSDAPDHPVLQLAIAQLDEYFTGERKHFSVPLDFGEAPWFYQEVWKTLQIIPYGKTRSYFDIAKRLGNPKAVRAVGMANHQNPLPIIIPCHRVIGKNGDWGGYAGGLTIKKWLLRMENPNRFRKQGDLFQEGVMG
ncbi:MAG: methylated-DNA--[protein]-cysteine S-methyltransferase [Saprospiraceae bacterium]|nr:methylated-DNA--[protein]-cysteine S-methyltransferase [Saprospiraceae bacterium]